MIELRVLGDVEVRTDQAQGRSIAVTQPKRLALLLYLALAEPGGFHSRDQLMALLWPESDAESARHALRNALHALRSALGENALLRRGEGSVGVNFDVLRCDALELRRLIAAGRLEEGMALWQGDLAPAFYVSGVAEFERWLEAQRTGIRQLVRATAWKRADQLAGAGAAEIEAVRLALGLDPCHEPGARRLMLLLAGSGDRSAALRVYDQLARQLAEDFDTEPAGETLSVLKQCRESPPFAAPSPPPALLMAAEPLRPAPRRALRMTAAVAVAAAALLVVGGDSYDTRAGRPGLSDAAVINAALPLPARYRTDTSAYSSYLRGLTLRYQARFAASRDTFVSLVERRPLYVPGLYGLAHAHIFTILNNLADPDDTWPKVETLSLRALALDNTAGSAWATLAASDMFTRMDFARAVERLDRAWAADSLDPDVIGLRAMSYRLRDRMDSALALAERAHRRDPTSLHFSRFLATQLYFARRYPDSRRAFQALVEDNPSWMPGYTNLAMIDRIAGHPSAALGWLRQARLAQGDTTGARALVATSDSAALTLLHAELRQDLAQLFRARRAGQRVSATDFAWAYAALDDTAGTMMWLDSMSAHHDAWRLAVRVDPGFDFLRRDPVYLAWERRAGLPPLPGQTNRRPFSPTATPEH
jgi:serine/threonine-protein kinase